MKTLKKISLVSLSKDNLTAEKMRNLLGGVWCNFGYENKAENEYWVVCGCYCHGAEVPDDAYEVQRHDMNRLFMSYN
jgi:natural product precursor